jgi:hypothetical protein
MSEYFVQKSIIIEKNKSKILDESKNMSISKIKKNISDQ